MTDYSDVILVIGALVIVMLVSLNANRLILHNSRNSVQSEVEYNAIATGQSVIDEARWTPYSRLDPSQPNYFFRDFPKKMATKVDTFTVDGKAEAVAIPGTNSLHRKITVTVSSPYMSNDVTVTYIKNQSD